METLVSLDEIEAVILDWQDDIAYMEDIEVNISSADTTDLARRLYSLLRRGLD